MNKLKLIQALKDRCDLTKDEANKVVRTFFSEMTNAMINGDRIEMSADSKNDGKNCKNGPEK